MSALHVPPAVAAGELRYFLLPNHMVLNESPLQLYECPILIYESSIL